MTIQVAGSTFVTNTRTITNYGITLSALGSVTGTASVNLTNANYFTATVTGATTWTFSNPLATGNACGFILKLTNGGSATQTWPASVAWSGGTAPTLTTSGIDMLVFITDDGGTTWKGSASITGV